MAVKISQFYARYRNDAIAAVMLTQVFATSVAGAIAWFLWQYADLDPLSAFTYSLVALICVQVIASPILVGLISKPLQVLSQTIAHLSNDPVQTQPPNINTSQFERSGLKDMVQTIYDLVVTQSKPAQTSTAAERALLQNLPVGVIALDANANVAFANIGAPTRQDSSGATAIDLLFADSDNLDTWLRTCQDKLRDTHMWRRIGSSLSDEGGSRRIYDVIGSYQKRSDSNIEAILAIIDRTAEYAPEEEDMDFIALAAHELRGPITVIRGYLELLSQELPEIKPEQQQLIDRLQVSSERLSGYINNILNVSRYDRNHLKLHLEELRLVDVIATLIPDLALRAKTQNRRLTFHVADDLPTIAADQSSLSEVISNFIDNAIKYSKDGGEVIVSATVKEQNFVELTVQDFGIGMPSSVVGNLFSKFYRSHRSRQTVSGTGLGLYISKAIIESHGGTVWVRSVEGEGSTFGFTAPIYSTVADKLAKNNNDNSKIIERRDGWIKNHAMFRR